MSWDSCLKDDVPLFTAAPGPPRHLGQELKRSFGGSKVGDMEPHVTVDDTDKGNSGEIVTFGYHLGANEDVNLTFANTTQYLNIVLNR